MNVNKKHSQKFVAISLAEVASAAKGQRVPQKRHQQTAAERRAALKTSGAGTALDLSQSVAALREKFQGA